MRDQTESDSQIGKEIDKVSLLSENGSRLAIRRVSPERTLLITIAGIFLAEVIAMIVLARVPPMSYALGTLLDALIMIVLIFPLLYFLVFRSLLTHIAEHERNETELRRIHAELEQRVAERTADLGQANQSLQEALEAAQKYQREITGLLDGTRAVLKQREFTAAARSIFESCKDLTGATCGYISLVKEGENEAVYLDSGTFSCEVDPELPMPIRGLREKAYACGEAVFENDFSTSEFARFLPTGHVPVNNVLFAPLMINRAAVGLLGLGNKAGGFTQDDARIASSFAEISSVALLNSRAEEQLRQAHAELELRVQQRTQELAQTNQELKAEIAERERAESQLRLLSAALEAAANGVIITGSHGGILWANPAFTQMTGYILDEVLGRNPSLLQSDQQNSEDYRQMWETILSGRVWRGEIASRRKDGSQYVEEQTITPLINKQGEITNFITIQQDISERKQAEQAVEEREALLRKVLETLPIGVALIDRDGQVTHGNLASQQIWAGIRYVGLQGYGEYKGWWLKSGERIAPEEWAAARAVSRGETSLNEEIEIECFDGTHKIILNSAVPILDEQGAIQGAIIVNKEITEGKLAEQALMQTNELLERYFSSIDTLIAYMDRDFNFIRVNEAYARSAGHPAEFFIGKNHFELYPHEENQAIFQRVVDSGEPFSVFEKPFEYPEYPERGVTYWDWSLQPVKDPDGAVQGVVLSLVDVTERKQAEVQLARQNQELRALSEAEHRQRELAEALARSLMALTSSLQLEDVLNTVLDQIRRAIPFRGADIVLIEGKTFRVAGFCGFEDLPDAVAAMQRSYTLDDFPLFQQICATHQPVLLPNTQEEAGWNVVPGMEWVRSYLAAPLVSDGQVIGIINLTSDQPELFNQESVERLMAFAAPAALALHNAQLYKAELTARQAAESLRAAVQALTQTLDLDQVIDTLLEHVSAISHSDMTGIALLEGETRLAVRTVHADERWTDKDQILSIAVSTGSSPLLQRLISSRKSVLVPDTMLSSEWQVLPGLEPIRCLLGVPLVSGEKFIGVVGLGKTEPDYFTNEHIQWAEALVGQATTSIQNAWLFEQVRASSERLQGLSRRLVEVQENERRYIASELHDEVGQALTTLMVGLQLIESAADRPQVVRAEVAEMGRVLETVIENLHRLAMDLRPASLDYLGLEAALRQHVEMMSEKLALEIQFAMTGIGERLPANIEIAFYRIVQEALNNVARHARATHVDVLITQREDCLALIIEDDGIGFDPAEATKGKRIGLHGMRERAEMLGGKLVVESLPGKGSTILVEVPYANPNTDRR